MRGTAIRSCEATSGEGSTQRCECDIDHLESFEPIGKLEEAARNRKAEAYAHAAEAVERRLGPCQEAEKQALDLSKSFGAIAEELKGGWPSEAQVASAEAEVEQLRSALAAVAAVVSSEHRVALEESRRALVRNVEGALIAVRTHDKPAMERETPAAGTAVTEAVEHGKVACEAG